MASPLKVFSRRSSELVRVGPALSGLGGTGQWERKELSFVEKHLKGLDMFPYEMPVRVQKSVKGGYLTLLAIGLVVAASFVNLTEFYHSVQGDATKSSKETKNPTPDPEAIPKFGVVVKVDGETFDDPSYFRWNFRQRAIYYSDSDENFPRQKITVPAVPCTVGNEVTVSTLVW
jgi:hypothetical protein